MSHFYVSFLRSKASDLSHEQMPFLNELKDCIFEKILKEQGTNLDRQLESPKVRNKDSKIYFSLGYFSMIIVQQASVSNYNSTMDINANYTMSDNESHLVALL